MIRELYQGFRKPEAFDSNELLNPKYALAAIEWIKEAHWVCGDEGISKGYDLLRGKWSPSYPETTGYSIPTLLNASHAFGMPELSALAKELADYLVKRSTPDGGVLHWQSSTHTRPVVFDTGQVIFGWLAAFEAFGDERYLKVAISAGDWLASIQDSSGMWNLYQHLGITKVIDTRVAWALLLLYQYSKNEIHLQAAVNNLNWAQGKQNDNGWFNNCSFFGTEDPYTHTIAYTAEGFLECGLLLHEQNFINISKRTVDALLACQRLDGSLASTYRSDWNVSSRSSCLTGNCQMGRLWLRFYEYTKDPRYLDGGRKALLYTAATQNLTTNNMNIRGAIAGSSPIFGKYERFKYPNWAAKFWVDALMEFDRQLSSKAALPYLG